jgi:hypothetical protein
MVPDPRLLGSGMFNIIITIINIIFIFIIINIIINKLKKTLLVLKNHKFDLKGKIKIYYYY